jgi:hypothetical protein
MEAIVVLYPRLAFGIDEFALMVTNFTDRQKTDEVLIGYPIDLRDGRQFLIPYIFEMFIETLFVIVEGVMGLFVAAGPYKLGGLEHLSLRTIFLFFHNVDIETESIFEFFNFFLAPEDDFFVIEFSILWLAL